MKYPVYFSLLLSVLLCACADRPAPSSYVYAKESAAFQARLSAQDEVVARYVAEDDTAMIKQSLQKRMDLQDEQREAALRFAADHPDLTESAHWLHAYMQSAPRPRVREVYDGFSAAVKATENGRLIEKFLAIEKVVVGDPYRDFEALDEAENLVRFSDVKGERYTLLFFTATWCGPCKVVAKELAPFIAAHDELTAVSLWIDKDVAKWKKTELYPWQNLIDPQGTDGLPFMSYGAGAPYFVLIDEADKVVFSSPGYGAFVEEEVSKLMGLKTSK